MSSGERTGRARTASVARETGARIYQAGKSSGALVYGYWPRAAREDAYEFFYRPGVSAGFIPTNDDQVCIWVGTETDWFLTDLRASNLHAVFHRILAEAAPEAVDRVSATQPLNSLRAFPGRPGFLRYPWGPGWALVGDAGYFKDPLSTHGITAALQDAELLARAIGSTLGGALAEPEALEAYRRTRDRHAAELLAISDRVASYGWDLDELRPLLMAMSRSMHGDLEVLDDLDRERYAAAA